MTTLVLIGIAIMIFYAGLLFGAWWVYRGNIIAMLDRHDDDGECEPVKNLRKFTGGYQPTGKFIPKLVPPIPPNMGSGVRRP